MPTTCPHCVASEWSQTDTHQQCCSVGARNTRSDRKLTFEITETPIRKRLLSSLWYPTVAFQRTHLRNNDRFVLKYCGFDGNFFSEVKWQICSRTKYCDIIYRSSAVIWYSCASVSCGHFFHGSIFNDSQGYWSSDIKTTCYYYWFDHRFLLRISNDQYAIPSRLKWFNQFRGIICSLFASIYCQDLL